MPHTVWTPPQRQGSPVLRASSLVLPTSLPLLPTSMSPSVVNVPPPSGRHARASVPYTGCRGRGQCPWLRHLAVPGVTSRHHTEMGHALSIPRHPAGCDAVRQAWAQSPVLCPGVALCSMWRPGPGCGPDVVCWLPPPPPRGLHEKGRDLKGGPRSGQTGGWRRLPKRLGGGYCRLQMPLRLALGVRGTVAGRRLGALEEEGGGAPPVPMRPPPPPALCQTLNLHRGAFIKPVGANCRALPPGTSTD